MLAAAPNKLQYGFTNWISNYFPVNNALFSHNNIGYEHWTYYGNGVFFFEPEFAFYMHFWSLQTQR